MKTLGHVPQRRGKSTALDVPELAAFEGVLKSSGDREISTTMAFVRILTTMVRDKTIGARVVPIVADESRTFGMEGMFRQLGIYSQLGQLYKPQDAAQLMYYREDKSGQILQEGINEAGALCSWIAAATSYSVSDVPMIPVYIFYSMFGFQRIGDLAWAAGDMRSRGFLIGGTSGRTTLNGEGLQHEDGHSHLFAAFIPNCVSYDPTYGYEVATIVQDGLRRMYAEQEDVYYYITVMNENYHHPEMPAGCEAGILRGAYLLRSGQETKKKLRVQLMGSGTILREVVAAAELLESDFGVAADVWSATSFTELRRDGLAVERYNLLHPESEPRVPYVTQMLEGHAGPVIAASDYMKSFADQIRPFVDRRFHALGTDGYGRSDYRRKLRDFFEVDRRWVALAALTALANDGTIERSELSAAIAKLASIRTNPIRFRCNVAATIEVRVPNIGDFHDVPVIDVLVKPGDTVKVEDPLIALESDKATMEVPSSHAGVVESISVKVGDKVNEGTMVLTLAADGVAANGVASNGAAKPPAAAPVAEVAPAPAPPPPAAPVVEAAPAPTEAASGVVHASPSIRRFARELGVDLHTVTGSGPNARITRDDVQSFVKRALASPAPRAGGGGGATFAGLPPWPKIDFAQFGPIERVTLSRIRKLSGPNLHRNWVSIPHVTNNEEADVTELEAFRKKLNAENPGAKVTMLAFVIKAVVAALRAFPDVNASLDGDELVHKHYYNIGFAADTPNGLMVPVLKGANEKGVLAIASETAALAAKARDGKLSLGDMQGATFTISSLGGIGGTSFTPIINAPEVGILGVSRSAIKPVWDGSAFVPRLMLPLSFSYDHRVIDGAQAARFNALLAATLADLRRAML